MLLHQQAGYQGTPGVFFVLVIILHRGVLKPMLHHFLSCPNSSRLCSWNIIIVTPLLRHTNEPLLFLRRIIFFAHPRGTHDIVIENKPGQIKCENRSCIFPKLAVWYWRYIVDNADNVRTGNVFLQRGPSHSWLTKQWCGTGFQSWCHIMALNSGAIL